MKYKINRNRTPLTDEDFSSGRNFNKVLKGYRSMKIPLYRSGKFLTTGSAIIVALAVGLIVLFGEDQDKPETPFISPPLSQVVIPSDTYRVYADSATEIDYKTGSKLHIPAGAFKDAAGNAIKGKVDIHYREFHDQKDIFLSGIPMTYDSAGKTYVFESAGMMEISATQDGKPVLTNPEKPIKVDMVSNTAEDRYNTYYLDTTAKKWINLNEANLLSKPLLGQAPVQEIDEVSKRLKETGNAESPDYAQGAPALAKCEQQVKVAVAEVKAVEKEKPMPIAQADRTKSKFHIVVDAGEFPEIAMYKGVHFQVKDEKTFNPASAKTEWEDVKLKKLSGIDYEVTFTKGTEVFKVVATLVFEGNDLAAAKKVYDKKYSEYQAKLTEKKEAEAKAKKEYEKAMAKINADIEKANAQTEKWYKEHEKNMTKSELIYRTFSVLRFGVYNADCLNSFPFGADIAATFTDEDGKVLNCKVVNLVEKNSMTLFPLYPVNGECAHFKFSPKGNEMIWAVTADDKLAIVDIKSFKAQQATTGKVKFKFKVIDVKFKTVDEAKKYLNV